MMPSGVPTCRVPEMQAGQAIGVIDMGFVAAFPALSSETQAESYACGSAVQHTVQDTWNLTLWDISAITGGYTLINMYLFQFDYKKGQKTGFHIK